MNIDEQVRFLKHIAEVHEKVAPLESLKYLSCANTILELQAKHEHVRKEILSLIEKYSESEQETPDKAAVKESDKAAVEEPNEAAGQQNDLTMEVSLKVSRMQDMEISPAEIKKDDIVTLKVSGESVNWIVVDEEKDSILLLAKELINDGMEMYKEYELNKNLTYDNSDIRKFLKEWIQGMDDAMLNLLEPVYKDDLATLPTERQMIGKNIYGEAENDTPFDPKHRIVTDKDGYGQWYWMRTKVEDSPAYFVYVYGDGYAACNNASATYVGVRPLIRMRKQ